MTGSPASNLYSIMRNVVLDWDVSSVGGFGLEELRVGFLDGRRALDGLHRDMRFFSKLRP